MGCFCGFQHIFIFETDVRLVLASNNPGKLAELHAMFAPLGVELLSQKDLGLGEAAEPFKTFVENALAKARFAAERSGLPAMADDAGLCVDAFNGLPGVDTAYYATLHGYPKGDDYNVTALLEQMEHVGNRRAALVSTLVALRTPQDPEPLIAVGRAVGEITRERRGTHGFGFDPVMFIPEHGQTFAELPPEVKNRVSHRGQAAAQMRELIRSHWLTGESVAESTGGQRHHGQHPNPAEGGLATCAHTGRPALARRDLVHACRPASSEQSATVVAVHPPALVS
jgi:XTP/dITP diphosphohydrolase